MVINNNKSNKIIKSRSFSDHRVALLLCMNQWKRTETSTSAAQQTKTLVSLKLTHLKHVFCAFNVI